VDVGSLADVSKVHAASIFRVEVSLLDELVQQTNRRKEWGYPFQYEPILAQF
jgi:hypothetical protein